jgi:hypothetical protein
LARSQTTFHDERNSTLDDPQQIIADLRHQFALRTAELDDAPAKAERAHAETAVAVTDMPALAVLMLDWQLEFGEMMKTRPKAVLSLVSRNAVA